MSTQAVLLPKKQPPPWVRTTQVSVGLFKVSLGVGSLLYLLLCLRHCSAHYLSWFIMFAVVASLDGLEMLISRWLPHFSSGRFKAVAGCTIVWTSWLLSFCYIALLIWGAVTLSWGLGCSSTGVWGVLLALDILCGVHSLYTVLFACMPVCCACCPLLGTVDSTRSGKKKEVAIDI